MTSIKVAYQSTVRRFTVPDTTTWLDLEYKIREIFSLPPTFKFTLSYTDDEGDVITLSTDLELQEFLTQPQSNLKFTLTPERQQSLVAETFSSNVSENGFVSVEKENFTSDNIFGETDRHVTTVMDAADEPSFKPTISSTSKGKQKEESSSTYETNEQEQENQEQTSPNNNEQREQRAPFIELAEQFQQLLDQFKDVLSNNPQLVEQANAIMDRILQNIPVDIDQLAQWLNTFRPEGEDTSTTTNAQEGETNNTNNPRGSGFGQFSPFFPPSHGLLSNPWIQRVAQEVSANVPEGLGNLENFARSAGFGLGPWNFNGACPYRQQQQQQEELSQEELKEKITLLHSMGFWEDDVKNEELLKKYNGNIEKVVESLVIQQSERNKNNSTDDIVDNK